MRIKVILSKDRRYVGRLLCNDLVLPIAAPTDDSLVPKIGRYQFKRIIRIADDQPKERAAYGAAIMYFSKETLSGKEDVVAIHGGDADSNGRLLPSMGGLRLTNRNMTALLHAPGYDALTLEVEEEDIGFFQRLRRKQLSDETPPQVSERPDSDGTNLFFWLWLYEMYHSDPIPIPIYKGGGGTYSGAGASGSWSDADTDAPDRNYQPTSVTAAIPEPLHVETSLATAAITETRSEQFSLPLIADPFKESITSESVQSAPAVEVSAIESVLSEPTASEVSTSDTSY